MKNSAQFRRPALIVIIILAVYWGLASLGIFNIPILKARDFFLRLRYKMTSPSKYTEDIVIIAINDSSYYGRWAWERNIFADLTYKLKAHQPSVIGFDLGFFDESTVSPSSDFLFSEALSDSGNIVLASYQDKDGRYVMPHTKFRAQTLGCGFTNKPEDIDNVIRQTRLFIRYALGNEIMDYSFGFKTACAFLNAPLGKIEFNGTEIACGDLKAPVRKDGILYLNYTAKPEDFKTILFSDAASGKVPLEFIKDKIVLIGVTDPVFHDISLTPFGKMSGVSIIANTITMLINRNFLHHIPVTADIIVLLFFSLLTGLTTSRKQIYKSTIAIVTILGGFAGISIILVTKNFIWDFFSIPLIVFTIYIVNSIINYTELLLQSFKMKKVVITDPLTGLGTRRYFLVRLERELKAMRDTDNISLVLFGIDHFEEIALEPSTEKANSVIKSIADQILKSSRKTRGVDFICRYGETEFCAILHKTTPQGALAYAKRIRQAKIDSAPSLTLSAGIVNAKDLGLRSAKVFVKSAEASLTRAREEGKVTVYDPKIDYVPIEKYKSEREISEIDLSYITEEFQEKHRQLAILVNKLRIAHDDVIKSERLSAVGKVAATIHHDLSKPIINLQSSLGMIKEDLDKIEIQELAAAKKLISSAIEETERLSKLSDSLKDIYRPISKEIQLVSINPILEEMLGLSSAQISKNKIKLTKNLYPSLPLVSANTGELKQVFLNLIINAVESMPAGGELEIITLISKDRQNTAEIKIRDTGYGIAAENMDKLFKAFFTTKKGEKGAGLGLYASMEIVKKYGGKIEVETLIDKGTTFKVYLPCSTVTPA